MRPSWKSCLASATDVAWAAVLLSLLGFFLGGTCTAKAQEPLPSFSGDCAPTVLTNRRALLVHEEDAGVWFHRAVVVCMTERLAVLPLFAERVRLLEQRLTISDERHTLMVRQVALAEEGEQAAVGALETAVRLRRRAEARAVRERSLRWLWAAVGVVLTGAAFALSVWGWEKAQEAVP
jgi:hypothetical protein